MINFKTLNVFLQIWLLPTICKCEAITDFCFDGNKEGKLSEYIRGLFGTFGTENGNGGKQNYLLYTNQRIHYQTIIPA